MLRCRGILFNFEFWSGEQNFVPNMWQVVFAHISVESRVVHSNVDGLLDGSGDAMTLSSNDLEVFPLMFWIIEFFSQWQAFTAYRSASSGPVEK